ncbi:MAG: GNAT family N-acetyltransferase [Gaiellaceae bacterium]
MILSLAENANTHTPLGPRDERIENDRYVIWLGADDHPSSTVVQRLRLTPDTIDETVEEIHALLRERGRRACTWEIGSSAHPPDLVERLLTRGLCDDSDPHVIAMVLARPPRASPSNVEARQLRSFEEFAASRDIAREAFGMPPRTTEETDQLRADYDVWLTRDDRAGFVALLDGRIVASANSTYTDRGVVLNAGATHPDARGRGAYTALVVARWDDAVRRGTPALITQAGAMSRPILERLGFEAVAQIRILLDEFE